jgi:xylulokinase
MTKILIVDLGTTYFKFTLFDRGGRLCQSCRIGLPLCRQQPSRLELPVDAFCDVVAKGIGTIRESAGGLSDVAAVSFATQTNSFLLLDADERSLTPLILWPDERAAEFEAEVHSRCDLPEFRAVTGVPQLGSQFMAAKLLWLQRRCPEVWDQTKRVCLISDYFTFLLTGKWVTEAGAAGLTGLIDIHRCRWWPEMLTRFGLDGRSLSAVVRAGTDLGPITAQAAERFGLPADCRFVVGCLDQYAGAIGVGNVAPGMISETTGTALAAVYCDDRFDAQLDPAVFQGPAFREGTYWRMAFSGISASYLHWYRDQLPDRPDFAQLTALAEPIEPGAAGLKLRTNVAMTSAADVFEGMSAAHTRGHAVRCILETVAFALCDQVAALSGSSRPQEIRCAGAAAGNDLWLQIKADVLGVATTATQCAEPTSLGAAVLAEASLSAGDVGQIAQQWVRLKPPHQPDPQRCRQYQVLHVDSKGGTP